MEPMQCHRAEKETFVYEPKISLGLESLLENEQQQQQTHLAFVCFSFYILLTTFFFFTLK